MTDKSATLSWHRPRPGATLWRILAVLLVLAPLGVLGAGCQPGTPLGPQIPVAESTDRALSDGADKITKAAAAKEEAERQRLYTEAATYFGAVERKFPGTETGLKALLSEAEAYDKANNKQQALTVYRNGLKKYSLGASPTSYQQAENAYQDLVKRMDAENSTHFQYKVMDALVKVVGGSPVVAIFVISIGVTLALWPLRAKQYRSMKEMQQYQPELKKIMDKYKDDPQLRNEKQMAFYKEHGINPMAGCIPLAAQMPVLWFLYNAISNYQFHFTNQHFLWINPATSAASASWPGPLAGAVARSLGEQDLLLLFVYALSMYFQTKLTPATDPSQAEQQKIMAIFMPAMFFVMMLQWHLPSAFVLYWFTSNVLTVAQQTYINRTMKIAPLNLNSAALDDDGDMKDAKPKSGSNGGGGGGAETTVRRVPGRNDKLISPKNRKSRK